MKIELDLKALVRTIPDFPKPGIMFRDVTTLFKHAAGFNACIERLVEPYRAVGIEAVAGIEARGFILGGAVADRLGTGFVPLRKKGKLPWRAIGQDYELEYGTDVIEVHEDAIRAGERILIVDDLIATGGTAGYATGVFSSRKLERATYDSVAFRFIAANDRPGRETIATFRRRFLKEIEGLFVQLLLLAREMGMRTMGTVALDGSDVLLIATGQGSLTKIHANASKHSALSGPIEAQLTRG